MNALPCGLPYEDLMQLLTVTALGRLSQDEAKRVFEKLADLGYRIAPVE